MAVDEPARLRASLPREVVEVIAQPARDAIEVLGRLSDVRDVQAFGERVHVRLGVEVDDAVLDRIAGALEDAGLTIVSVRRVPTSLEDVFIDRITAEASPEPDALKEQR